MVQWLRIHLPMGEEFGGVDTCICMAESLHSSPEIVTILLIGYTSIQNKRLTNKRICLPMQGMRV